MKMKPIILVRSINLLKAKQNYRVAYNIFNTFCILSFGNRCFKPFFPQDIEEYETVKALFEPFPAPTKNIVRVLTRFREINLNTISHRL